MVAARDEMQATLEILIQETGALRLRVEALELALRHGESAESLSPAEASGTTLPPGTGIAAGSAAEIVGFAGRTLMILGGAFLLRAISNAAVLPSASGPLLGLLYALGWFWKADTIREADQKASAFFYGLSGIAIAYPLIWEATARFHLLPGAIAAPALVAFLAAGVFVARRRCLESLAFVSTAAAVATGFALLFATREFILYSTALIALAVVVESFELRPRWPELRWVPAIALDAALLLLAVLVSQPRMSAEMAAALPAHGIIAVSLAAALVYLSTVAAATLALRREISLFELLQVSASLLCGIGTALVAIAVSDGSPAGIGVATSMIGIACYGAAFVSIDRPATDARQPRRNFYAYSTFAGVLTGAGTLLALSSTWLALAWLAFGAVAITLGIVFDRNTLRLHGSLFVAAAAFPSGLATLVQHGLLGPMEQMQPAATPIAAAVAVAAAACHAALSLRRARGEPDWSAHVPGLLVAAVAASTLAAIVAPLLAALLFRVLPPLDPMAALASMRTCVLSVLAVALAWAGLRWSRQDLVWLVYPLMVAAGARLLWEDLRYGAPVHLFLAFGFYGAALVFTSRVLRQRT